jgi:antirestriction protein ArdC
MSENWLNKLLLSVEQFKLRLMRPNHPDWLLVGVDANDDNQLYILSNGGMANINCAPIELYTDEIKYCAREIISQGELFLKTSEKSVRIVNGRSVYSYSIKPNTDDLQVNAASQKMHFSNTFIRWQRSHQLSHPAGTRRKDA